MNALCCIGYFDVYCMYFTWLCCLGDLKPTIRNGKDERGIKGNIQKKRKKGKIAILS